MIRTDLADQVKPRIYTHVLNFSGGYVFLPSRWIVMGSVSAIYESMGTTNSEIDVDRRDTELFFNDANLIVEKGFRISKEQTMQVALGDDVPTSPDARREGYKSIPVVQVGFRQRFWDGHLIASASVSAHYIWNTYRFSPGSGNLNKDAGGRLEGSLLWNFWRGMYISVSAGGQVSHYLDGSADRTYRNAVGFGYFFPKHWRLSAAISNGTYLDDTEAVLWFVDQYRRTVSASLSYDF